MMGIKFTKLSTWFIHNKEKIEIVMVGLTFSGKTTILNMRKPPQILQPFPFTVGLNFGTIEYKDVTFSVMDVGGQGRIRPIWRHHFSKIQALVYVVDSNDRDRIVDARDDLHNNLNEEAFKDVILLVLANKQDLPNAMNAVEMTDQLRLQSLEHRPWHIQSTCATSGEGLHEGLNWLYNNLANKNN